MLFIIYYLNHFLGGLAAKQIRIANSCLMALCANSWQFCAQANTTWETMLSSFAYVLSSFTAMPCTCWHFAYCFGTETQHYCFRAKGLSEVMLGTAFIVLNPSEPCLRLYKSRCTACDCQGSTYHACYRTVRASLQLLKLMWFLWFCNATRAHFQGCGPACILPSCSVPSMYRIIRLFLTGYSYNMLGKGYYDCCNVIHSAVPLVTISALSSDHLEPWIGGPFLEEYHLWPLWPHGNGSNVLYKKLSTTQQ